MRTYKSGTEKIVILFHYIIIHDKCNSEQLNYISREKESKEKIDLLKFSRTVTFTYLKQQNSRPSETLSI